MTNIPIWKRKERDTQAVIDHGSSEIVLGRVARPLT